MDKDTDIKENTTIGDINTLNYCGIPHIHSVDHIYKYIELLWHSQYSFSRSYLVSHRSFY